MSNEKRSCFVQVFNALKEYIMMNLSDNCDYDISLGVAVEEAGNLKS
jgi:hypothetical protein